MITEILKTVIEDVNIEIKLFTNSEGKWYGKFGVMSKDLDCNEVISLNYYTEVDSAIKAYNKFINA